MSFAVSIIIALVTATVVSPESITLTKLKTSETGSSIFSPTTLVGESS